MALDEIRYRRISELFIYQYSSLIVNISRIPKLFRYVNPCTFIQFHGRLVRNWCGSFGVIYSRKRVHRDTKLLLISSLALVPNLHCLWAAFTISIDFCKLPNYKEKDIKI